MAILENNEKNVFFEIKLIKSNYLDLESTSEYEKWVPFQLLLKVPGKEYTYLDGNLTFNVYEIKQLLLDLKNIIEEKKEKKRISHYSFYCSEAYFEFNLDEPLEDDIIEVSLWMNVGALTNGKYYGFDEGYKFNVTIMVLEFFYKKMEIELSNLFD